MVYTQQVIDTIPMRPKVGLVLSGGGARGAAHIGVIRLLEEMNIPIDYVVGTSMGAIVGGLYAIGYTADDIDSLMMAQDWKSLLSNDTPRRQQPYTQRMERKLYQISIPYEKNALTENSVHYRDAGIKVRRSSLQTFPKVLARPGLIDGENILSEFIRLTSSYGDSVSYDLLPHPFACVAADLVTGKEIVLKEGRLAESMRASMSIPGVFYPVYKDNQVLVDGGIVNNYPVNVARNMGADIIIGVELNSAHIESRDLQSFASIFERLIGTLGTELHEQNLSNTDILIQPQVKQFPVMGFDPQNLRQLIDIGYKTAEQSKPLLDSLKKQLSLAPTDAAKEPMMPNQIPAAPSIQASDIPSSPTDMVALGLRIDSEDGAAALLHVGVNHLNLSGLKFDLTSRLSIHPWISGHISYSKPNMPQVNAAVKYGYAHIVSPYSNRYDAISYHFCGTDLYLSDMLSRRFDLRIGARYDNYWESNATSYSPRIAHTTLYALLRNDLYDAAYTPTSGYSYGIEVSYNIKDKSPQGSNFWAFQADASALIPLGSTTALLPALYARSLFGKSIPTIYTNAMGGYLPQHYLPHQVPFVGFVGCEFMNSHLLIPCIGLRQRLFTDVYATSFVNYAYSTDGPSNDYASQGIWGIGAQLSYDTTIGPLALSIQWNDLYHRLGAYFSFGYEF